MGMAVGVNVGGREVVDLRDRPALQNLLGRAHGPDGVIQEDESLGMLSYILHIVGSAE